MVTFSIPLINPWVYSVLPFSDLCRSKVGRSGTIGDHQGIVTAVTVDDVSSVQSQESISSCGKEGVVAGGSGEIVSVAGQVKAVARLAAGAVTCSRE